MLTSRLLRALPEIPSPVLTVYLDTNLADPANRNLLPAYRIWLKSQGEALAQTVPSPERKAFLAQLARVEEYLRAGPPKQRGLALFAGPNTWEVVPLTMKVRNEAFWGRPSFAQLLWLLDEHRPCGLTVLSRKGARFYLRWFGELIQLDEKRYPVPDPGWRRKDLGKFSQPGVYKSRGSQHDLFDRRRDAQSRHFYREVAARMQFWTEEKSLGATFLVGSEEMAAGVFEELPKAFREQVVVVPGNLGWMPRAELRRRLERRFERWEREHEVALVDALVESERGAVLGIDETLARLQQGAARSLVVESGLDASLKRCAVCGWVDRVAGPSCTVCGGAREPASLRDALPELARRHGASIEVVAGDAAEKLRAAGGIGAWLRPIELPVRSAAS